MVYQRTSLTPRQARGKMMNGAPNPIDVYDSNVTLPA